MALLSTCVFLLALAQQIMAQYNPLITNGTCYYSRGEESDEVYAPCGNAGNGHLACCQLGDTCNTDNVCASVLSVGGVYTYLAGCTDIDYEHENCPDKGEYSDLQWTGMRLCPHDGSSPQNWFTCDNDHSPTVRESDESKKCTCELLSPADVPVMILAKAMDARGVLPATKGQSIYWFGGMAPATSGIVMPTSSSVTSSASKQTLIPPTTISSTIATRSTSISTKSPTSTSNTNMSTPTTVSASANASDQTGFSTLTTGQKAGAGIAIATFTSCAIALILFLIHRHLQKQKANQDKSNMSIDSEKPPADAEPTLPNVDAASFQSAPWQTPGKSAELPASPAATELGVGLPSRQNSSSENSTTIVNSPSWNGSLSQSPKRTSSTDNQVYRPFRYQPTTTLGGIQELPDHERPLWARTGFGTYGPDRGYNVAHEKLVEGNVARLGGGESRMGLGVAVTGDGDGRVDIGRSTSGNGRGRDVHELPG